MRENQIQEAVKQGVSAGLKATLGSHPNSVAASARSTLVSQITGQVVANLKIEAEKGITDPGTVALIADLRSEVEDHKKRRLRAIAAHNIIARRFGVMEPTADA